MKKYDVMLQGGLKLTISEAEKQGMEKSMLKGESIVTVGNNKFKSSIIKGIFEIKEEVRDNKEAWLQSNREWNEECLKLSKRSKQEKIDSELVIRILPGLKLSRITPTDELIAVLQTNIKAYFDVFPKAPRCPSRVWWPIISKGISRDVVSKWWEYVSRNDGAIEEWERYNS
jgi:hypothetical protein